MLRPEDIPIWELAKVHLRVRSNDIHTLISTVFAQNLLLAHPEAKTDIVLHAILLHDTGWSKVEQEKLLLAFGPGAKYPEIQRQHELEGVTVATEILQQLGYSSAHIQAVTAIIDGHDTTTQARSLEDSLVKDADKLWRYSSQAIPVIQGWFGITKPEMLVILEEYVLPGFLTEVGKQTARTMLDIEKILLQQDSFLH